MMPIRSLFVALGLAVAMPALAAPVTLTNPGFESTKPGQGGFPEGWVGIQHRGEDSYDFVLDSGQKRSGTQSLRIKKIGPEPFGTITQIMQGAPYAGKTVRLSGWLRTEGVPEGRKGAGLTIAALKSGSFLAHDYMKHARVRGTKDWARYSIVFAVPPGTNRLEIGATLEGAGTLWVDDFELEIVEP